MEKSTVRKELLARRSVMETHYRLEANHAIADRLFALPEWHAGKVIGCYISLPREVDTHFLIGQALAQGKKIAAPVIDWQHGSLIFHEVTDFFSLIPGSMGILEPKTAPRVGAENIDCFIVPGVGFDEQGFRLGYGKGFYDRLLSTASGPRLGLGFDCQIVNQLPRVDHDVPMHYVITETRIIRGLA